MGRSILLLCVGLGHQSPFGLKAQPSLPAFFYRAVRSGVDASSFFLVGVAEAIRSPFPPPRKTLTPKSKCLPMPNQSGSDPLAPPQMGEDLISDLPDEVLHAVLFRLGSARAAARTSVLSQRWRRVWAQMPGILLDNSVEARPPAPASFLDAVDGALAGCLAPALEHLSITMFANPAICVPAERVAPWLRFAAERVAGELCLFMHPLPPLDTEEADLELPVCGGAKTIELFLYSQWRLRLQPAGLFKALTVLFIRGKMEGSELTTLVSTQCPRLSSLNLSGRLVAVADVSVLSDSLRSLLYCVRNTQRLEVVAPSLEELTLSPSTDEARILISAPKIGKLRWNGTYDPRYHRFSDIARHLLLLDISHFSEAASLIWRFDEVDVLDLQLFIKGVVGYQSFLDATKKMPKCKTLRVTVLWEPHGLASVILHLIRSCNSMRKFSLMLYHNGLLEHSCPSSCPCCFEDSRRIDDIDLSSLQELEISSSKISHEELELMELLSRCNARYLKKLLINCKAPATPETKEVCEKVRTMCRPNVEVEFYVFPDGPDGRRVRLD